MIIRTTNDPNYLIVEAGNSFTVYEKFGNSFVVASENSWKELSWAEAEIKVINKVIKMRKTKVEIIKETKEYYQDTTKRSLSPSGGCEYINRNGNMCAVGRCCVNPEKIPPSLFVEHIENLEEYLKEEYLGHDKYFWGDLQAFHDINGNWDENGITPLGLKRYNSLIEKYSE